MVSGTASAGGGARGSAGPAPSSRHSSASATPRDHRLMLVNTKKKACCVDQSWRLTYPDVDRES
eukprot:3598386-Lingulodinium_polyedra.AAC.1